MVIIRKATPEDLGGITEIYNDAVLKTVGTFDTETKNDAAQQIWFAHHDSRHPILVAEQDGCIIGWASLSQWSDRRAYADTAEISLYVHEDYRGRGVGRRLMQAIIQEGQMAGLHTVIARIAEGNEKSVYLHESVGFKHIGIMKEVGQKFGKRLDVHLMQLLYRS